MTDKSNDNAYDLGAIDIAWCPGCGNFQILKAVKKALSELEIDPAGLVMVSGIGQAAKLPQYLKCNYFNGLHGRSLPPAAAIKAANPRLTVIAESGDGCSFGEGGNHFIHAIRRNPDVANVVHDNMIYGLTKGQASPTTRRGFTTPVQTRGVFLEPFNPVSVAVALNASFVARAFSGDIDETAELIKKAVKHKGYALVDLLHPCVSFNHQNTFKWFKDNTYYLDDSYDPRDRAAAFEKAMDLEKLALGVIYLGPEKPCFEETQYPYDESDEPLYARKSAVEKLKETVDAYRKS